MVNQTDFIDHLRRRMNKSLEEGFYLESITCSYAIIENRTKRLLEHLEKSAKNMYISQKTQYLYTQILKENQEIDGNRKKLISFIEYRLNKDKILEVLPDIEHISDIKSPITNMENQKLMSFYRQRNEIAHGLAKYDSQNPHLIDFDNFIDLAFLGKEVAEKLSSIASATKRKKRQLKK